MQLMKYGIIGTLRITTHDDAMGCLSLEPTGGQAPKSQLNPS